MDDSEKVELVRLYFKLGLKHTEILYSLSHINGIVMSMRTLHRILRTSGLYRRKNYTDLLNVSLYLLELLKGSTCMNGYKLMHLKCIQKGYVVKQETVRLLLHILDPEGISQRRRHRLKRRQYFNTGPNFCWHVDSYDKLKPYGICINGAIDGFSRFIVWLNAYCTNSDPKVIGSYYLESVKCKLGCPSRIRVDAGTENGHMCQMQSALRWDHSDEYARRSYIVGSSNHNQRIESWWAFLRQHHAQFWMNLFESLKDRDLFVGDFLDRNLIQFVFMKLIQKELYEVKYLWNCHQIRATRNCRAPSGRPITMYYCPQLYRTCDRGFQVSIPQVQVCENYCKKPGPAPCDETVFEIACQTMMENSWEQPKTHEEGVALYGNLRQEIRGNL